jgi:flagellar biosynthesis/type III secretory pathway protein FliH
VPAAPIRAAEPRLRTLLSACATLSVVADPEVAPGGAVVETEAGVVDARIETRLAALARAAGEGAR